MKDRDIQKAGVPAGPLLKIALSLMGPAAQAGLKKREITEMLRNLVAAPDAFLADPLTPAKGIQPFKCGTNKGVGCFSDE